MFTDYVDSLTRDRAISCPDPVELMDGWSLEAELFEGEFSEAAIWQILEEILPILQNLHDRHEIHGDIRPATIIRQRRDLQLILSRGDVITPNSIGSVEYAAPEQLYGAVNYSSDLYSLGMTCLRLLTQLSPFDLIDHRACGAWQSYLSQPLSPALQAILNKLVEPIPYIRYQSVTQVLQDMKTLTILNANGSEDSSSIPISTLSKTLTTMSLPSATIFDPATQQWYRLSCESKLSDTTGKIASFLKARQAIATASQPEAEPEEDDLLTPKQLVFRGLIASAGTAVLGLAGFCLFTCLSVISLALTTPPPASTTAATQPLSPNPQSHSHLPPAIAPGNGVPPR